MLNTSRFFSRLSYHSGVVIPPFFPGYMKKAFFNRTSFEPVFMKYQFDEESNKYIKARFRNLLDDYKKDFAKSSCLVSLSIGQPVHYGNFLAATLALVNENFDSCVFVLGDTLKRHTMIISQRETEEAMYIRAKFEGDQWVEKNVSMLSKLQIPWKIIRWDHWLNDPRYPNLVERIKRDIGKDKEYKEIFDEDASDFIDRVKNRNELAISEDEARKRCLNYLVEENAAMCLWPNEQCEFELYANGRTKSMQATYEKYIQVLHPHLLRPISLRFRKVEHILKNSDDKQEKEIVNDSSRPTIFIK